MKREALVVASRAYLATQDTTCELDPSTRIGFREEVQARANMENGTQECTRCRGTGNRASLDEYERNQGIEDTCYHCDHGRVDAATAHEDRIGALVSCLAVAIVNAERENANNDPDGEGFDFSAAENGMGVRDYTIERIWARESQVGGEIAHLSDNVINAMLAIAKL